MRKLTPGTIKGTLHRFAETTSLQGIPHANRSSSWIGKSLWTIFFLAACGMVVYQLIDVFTKYYERETSSSVKLGYADLDFPSVTICNLNPIRKSQAHLAGKSFQDFLSSIHISDSVSTDVPSSTQKEATFYQTPAPGSVRKVIPNTVAIGSQPTKKPNGNYNTGQPAKNTEKPLRQVKYSKYRRLCGVEASYYFYFIYFYFPKYLIVIVMPLNSYLIRYPISNVLMLFSSY